MEMFLTLHYLAHSFWGVAGLGCRVFLLRVRRVCLTSKENQEKREQNLEPTLFPLPLPWSMFPRMGTRMRAGQIMQRWYISALGRVTRAFPLFAVVVQWLWHLEGTLKKIARLVNDSRETGRQANGEEGSSQGFPDKMKGERKLSEFLFKNHFGGLCLNERTVSWHA